MLITDMDFTFNKIKKYANNKDTIQWRASPFENKRENFSLEANGRI